MALHRDRVREILGASVSAIGGVGFAVWALGLWEADLRVPFTYGADALFAGAGIKSLVDGGSFVHNARIGAPAGASWLDFPTLDGAHLALMRPIAWVTRDYALTMNLYFLLGFALVALASYGVMRACRISRVPSIVLSILYAGLPYHLMRGEMHLFLGAYWVVPLAVLLCLWIVHAPGLLVPDEGPWRLMLRDRRTQVALVVCVLLGASGVYYAFFGCFLMLVAGLAGALRGRGGRRLVVSAALVLLVCLTVGAGLAEGLVYSSQAGANPEAPERSASDAELYALRLPQLVLPVTGHRIEWFAWGKDMYRTLLELRVIGGNNENDTSSLGLLFSMGFVGLLGVAVFGNERLRRSESGTLALLSLASFLLATVSGFGMLFAMVVSPQIRAYNRISVVIAFMAALAIGKVLDAIRTRPGADSRSLTSFVVLCVALLVVGALDMTPAALAPKYDDLAAVYRADEAYVSQVEALLPADAMVFQLPYIPFPESGPVGKLQDYDHFRAYLHSDDLRWSYGAMRGRPSDLWQRQVSALPTLTFIQEIRAAGFRGVWLDTWGYADGGAAITAELSSVLQTEPLVSDDGRVAFYEVP